MKTSILAVTLLAGLVSGCAYDPYNGGYGYGPGPVAVAPPPVVVAPSPRAEERAYQAGVREGQERAAARDWREERRGW